MIGAFISSCTATGITSAITLEMDDHSHENLPGSLRQHESSADNDQAAAASSSGAPPSNRAPERAAIADAVAARLEQQKRREAGSGAEADDVKAAAAHKTKVRRIINDMTGAVSYEKAHACLSLVHTLLDNIVQHPLDDKYRSFRASQPRIAKTVLALDGAQDLLVTTGFRTRTRDFQLEWFVPDAATWTPPSSLGFKRLQWSADVIATRTQEYEEHAARAKFNKEREAAAETSRKARALAEAQEDRERVAVRAQRERAARLAQEERQNKEQDEERQRDKDHLADAAPSTDSGT